MREHRTLIRERWSQCSANYDACKSTERVEVVIEWPDGGEPSKKGLAAGDWTLLPAPAERRHMQDAGEGE